METIDLPRGPATAPWKTAVKAVLQTILVFIAAILLLTAGTFIYHRIKTSKELDLLKEKGYYNPVSVGDHSLNVAIFGNPNGKHTIVSLSGLKNGDYSVTERQMTGILEKDDLVVFVDRAGYGLSDDTDRAMTTENIVEDYRTALKNAGLEAPYVLMPQGIGGAYAIYWSCRYPDEIEAIVLIDGIEFYSGLCWCCGQEYEKTDTESKIHVFIQKLGYCRFRNYIFPEGFSEEEILLGNALMYMTDDSIAPLSEAELAEQNTKEALDNIVKTGIPKLYICSEWGFQTYEDLIMRYEWIKRQDGKDGYETPAFTLSKDDEQVKELLGKYEKKRRDELYPYLEKLGNCEIVLLPGIQPIYMQRQTECGEIIKRFIDSLDK